MAGLILGRVEGQTIRIGDDITIVILEDRRGKKRLQIQAPPSVPIHRGELYERIQAEKLEQKPPHPGEENKGGM
jgi:carbon storage regulator